MRKLSLLILVAGLFLAVPTAARADFAVLYPDGAEAFAIHLAPGVNVVALLNDGADPDIFTMHLDGFSNPALASLIGLPAGRAMWFNFLGVNPAGRAIYALYLNQGSGFFFVTNIVL